MKKYQASVLFVCLGNICRSPTAEAVFSQLLKTRGLQEQIKVDSCGTGSWHIGQEPDERAQKAALKQGLDLSRLRARRLQDKDFKDFDYILAMDTRNLADILKQAPQQFQGKIQLLMDYAPDKSVLEVPDPYYGEQDGFERMVSMIQSACEGLLKTIEPHD